MRRLFCILFVLLFSMLSMATKKAPLYIIDGSFETQNQLSPEQIGSVTILDSAEAVDIYGERASGGVVIIRTKKFEAENFKQPREESTNIKEQRKNPKKDRDILVLILICLLSSPLSKWLIKWYTKEENSWDSLIATGIWMPILEEYYTNEELTHKWVDNENFSMGYDNFKTSVVDYAHDYAVSTCWYYVPHTNEFLAYLRSILGDVWTGATTAADALEAGEATLIDIFNGE